MQPKSGKTQENDELTIVKGLILSRELELLHLNNNILRLQERSQILEDRCQEIIAKGKEKEDTLKQNVALLTSTGKEFDSKIKELERTIGNFKVERIESHGALLSALDDLKSCQKIAVSDMRLQLDESELKLEELRTFTMEKLMLEEEISRIFLSRALSLQATIQHFHGSAGERENKDIYGLRFDVANRQRPGTTEMPVSTCAQTDLMGLKWDASTIEEHQNCPSN